MILSKNIYNNIFLYSPLCHLAAVIAFYSLSKGLLALHILVYSLRSLGGLPQLPSHMGNADFEDGLPYADL